MRFHGRYPWFWAALLWLPWVPAMARDLTLPVESGSEDIVPLAEALGSSTRWLWLGFERDHVKAIAEDRRSLSLPMDVELLGIDAPRLVRGVIRSSLRDDPARRRYVYWGSPVDVSAALDLGVDPAKAWLVRYNPATRDGLSTPLPVSDAEFKRLQGASP